MVPGVMPGTFCTLTELSWALSVFTLARSAGEEYWMTLSVKEELFAFAAPVT